MDERYSLPNYHYGQHEELDGDEIVCDISIVLFIVYSFSFFFSFFPFNEKPEDVVEADVTKVADDHKDDPNKHQQSSSVFSLDKSLSLLFLFDKVELDQMLETEDTWLVGDPKYCLGVDESQKWHHWPCIVLKGKCKPHKARKDAQHGEEVNLHQCISKLIGTFEADQVYNPKRQHCQARHLYRDS